VTNTLTTRTEVADFLTGLGRRVEDTDVTAHPELQNYAGMWATEYTGNFGFMVDMKNSALEYGRLTVPQARGALNCLRAQLAKKPSAARSVTAQAIEPGVYVTADAIVKVQKNKAKTNVYALVWESFGGTRLTLDGETVQARWVYSPGLIGTLTTDNRMTVDEAKKFALKYGQCARCGRTLVAAESVERGIGPVCMKWFSF
jgi:hypothetical protein